MVAENVGLAETFVVDKRKAVRALARGRRVAFKTRNSAGRARRRASHGRDEADDYFTVPLLCSKCMYVYIYVLRAIDAVTYDAAPNAAENFLLNYG